MAQWDHIIGIKAWLLFTTKSIPIKMYFCVLYLIIRKTGHLQCTFFIYSGLRLLTNICLDFALPLIVENKMTKPEKSGAWCGGGLEGDTPN